MEDRTLRIWLVGTDEALLERIVRRFDLEGERAQLQAFPSLPAALAAAAPPGAPADAPGPLGLPDVLLIDDSSGGPGWHLWLDALKSVHPDLATLVLTAQRPGGRVPPLFDPGLARLHPRRVSGSLVAAIRRAGERRVRESSLPT